MPFRTVYHANFQRRPANSSGFPLLLHTNSGLTLIRPFVQTILRLLVSDSFVRVEGESVSLASTPTQFVTVNRHPQKQYWPAREQVTNVLSTGPPNRSKLGRQRVITQRIMITTCSFHISDLASDLGQNSDPHTLSFKTITTSEWSMCNVNTIP